LLIIFSLANLCTCDEGGPSEPCSPAESDKENKEVEKQREGGEPEEKPEAEGIFVCLSLFILRQMERFFFPRLSNMWYL
jgi:hypothetical protein